MGEKRFSEMTTYPPELLEMIRTEILDGQPLPVAILGTATQIASGRAGPEGQTEAHAKEATQWNILRFELQQTYILEHGSWSPIFKMFPDNKYDEYLSLLSQDPTAKQLVGEICGIRKNRFPQFAYIYNQISSAYAGLYDEAVRQGLDKLSPQNT